MPKLQTSRSSLLIFLSVTLISALLVLLNSTDNTTHAAPIDSTPSLEPTVANTQTAIAVTAQALFESTLSVQQTATKDAEIQAGISATLNAYASATAQSVRNTLIEGLQPISAENARDLKPIRMLKGHSQSVTALAFNRAGTQLAAVSEDNSISLWDIKAATLVNSVRAFNKRYAVDFSADGHRIASGNADGTVRIWDVTTTKEQVIGSSQRNSVITSVAFSTDGLMIAAGDVNGLFYAWDVSTGKSQFNFQAHGDAVTSVKFSPDGSRFATSGTDGAIRVWDTKSGAMILKIAGNKITKIAFSPDSTLLASASFTGDITLLSVATGDVRANLKGNTDWVSGISFSPDGATLATSSADGSIRLWNIQDLKKVSLLVTLKGQTQIINDVQWSPDTAHLASANQDGTITIWAVNKH